MFKGDNKCACSAISSVLVIVGALNWGLVGLGNFIGYNLNVVNLIFGRIAYLEDIIYVLVGLAAIVMLAGCKCKGCCETKTSSGSNM